MSVSYIDKIVNATLRITTNGTIVFASAPGLEFFQRDIRKHSIFNVFADSDENLSNFLLDATNNPSTSFTTQVNINTQISDVEIQAFKLAQIDQIVLFVRDITKWKTLERNAAIALNTDSVTGLHTREYLPTLISSEKNKLNESMFMLAGVTNLRKINEKYGYAIGDMVLKEFTTRLSMILDDGDSLIRFSGSEFGILTNHLSTADAHKLSEKILDVASSPFYAIISTAPIVATMAIGATIYSGDDLDEMLNQTTSAFTESERQGKNKFVLFHEFHNQDLRLSAIDGEMQNGINEGEFYLLYQPQFRPDGKTLVGAEALMRWESSKFGFVSPGEFIPVAENNGLIEFLGTWSLRMSCYFLHSINKTVPKFKCSVNVSSYQLQNRNFLTMLIDIIDQTKVDPHNLNLEITESLLMSNPDDVQLLLEEIAKLGVSVSIDDFGTGYSSLSYLSKFKLSALKVDKAFVDNVATSQHDRIIAKAIIGLAHDLGLYSVTEGVEDTTQLEFVSGLGCNIIQGYLFSKPIRSGLILDNLNNNIWTGLTNEYSG